MTKKEKVMLALHSCSRSSDDKCEGCPYIDDDACFEKMSSDALDVFKASPDIVRCRECKYGYILNPCDGFDRCYISCNLHKMAIRFGNWFCADGKRFME